MPTDAEREEALNALAGRVRCKNCHQFIKDNVELAADGKRLCKSCGFELGAEALGLPRSAGPLAEAALAVASDDMHTALGAMGRFMMAATGELALDAMGEEAAAKRKKAIAKHRVGRKRSKRGRAKTKKRGARGGGGGGGQRPGRPRGNVRGR